MYKKWVLSLRTVAGSILLIKAYTDSMPGYGIQQWWKKLAFNILLSVDVPKVSMADASAIKILYCF